MSEEIGGIVSVDVDDEFSYLTRIVVNCTREFFSSKGNWENLFGDYYVFKTGMPYDKEEMGLSINPEENQLVFDVLWGEKKHTDVIYQFIDDLMKPKKEKSENGKKE